ncbi:MAG: asparagine synthetase B, partial [Candidatus Kapaibacteriota bacterium]
MDFAQADHLKSYGLAYWILKQGLAVDWLLNYRGGSFITDYNPLVETEARIRGVSFEVLDGSSASQIYSLVQSPDQNMELIHLEKAPKIAVYASPGTQPWDDAVLLVLSYAGIEHDILWDEEVLQGKLSEYDWVHLHHEDITGQYGKFWASYSSVPWYIEQVTLNETMAKKLGFAKVSEMKLAVAIKIREYVANGGFLFAMCSATDTYDIALAAHNVDICESVFDGDPADPNANSKLDFSQTLSFENFKVILDPFYYEFSDIDCPPDIRNIDQNNDYFTLFEFSAKFDPVPTMLTQNHVNVIKGFLGQTTAFHLNKIKKGITILGIREGTDEVRY